MRSAGKAKRRDERAMKIKAKLRIGIGVRSQGVAPLWSSFVSAWRRNVAELKCDVNRWKGVERR